MDYDTYEKVCAHLTECGFDPEQKGEDLLGWSVWRMVVHERVRAHYEGYDEGYAAGHEAGQEDLGETIAEAITILQDCIPDHGGLDDLDGITIGIDDGNDKEGN